jgi:DNA-binding MarR family transcriptional regulator
VRRKIRRPAAGSPADFPCACATARRAARAVTQLYDGHLRASEIEAPQFALLSALDAHGPCSQAAIGQRVALDKTTLSRNLKRLKERGWIDTAVAADGRERRYVLSRLGRLRLSAARPAWRRAQAQLRTSMSRQEWDAMWKALRVMTDAAHAAHSARSGRERYAGGRNPLP